eukprot:858540_1
MQKTPRSKKQKKHNMFKQKTPSSKKKKKHGFKRKTPSSKKKKKHEFKQKTPSSKKKKKQKQHIAKQTTGSSASPCAIASNSLCVSGSSNNPVNGNCKTPKSSTIKRKRKRKHKRRNSKSSGNLDFLDKSSKTALAEDVGDNDDFAVNSRKKRRRLRRILDDDLLSPTGSAPCSSILNSISQLGPSEHVTSGQVGPSWQVVGTSGQVSGASGQVTGTSGHVASGQVTGASGQVAGIIGKSTVGQSLDSTSKSAIKGSVQAARERYLFGDLEAEEIDPNKTADSDSSESSDEEIFCKVCLSGNYADRLLLCDSCDAGYHLHCLSPPLSGIPEGDWQCAPCTRHRRDLDEEQEENGGIDGFIANEHAVDYYHYYEIPKSESSKSCRQPDPATPLKGTTSKRQPTPKLSPKIEKAVRKAARKADRSAQKRREKSEKHQNDRVSASLAACASARDELSAVARLMEEESGRESDGGSAGEAESCDESSRTIGETQSTSSRSPKDFFLAALESNDVRAMIRALNAGVPVREIHGFFASLHEWFRRQNERICEAANIVGELMAAGFQHSPNAQFPVPGMKLSLQPARFGDSEDLDIEECDRLSKALSRRSFSRAIVALSRRTALHQRPVRSLKGVRVWVADQVARWFQASSDGNLGDLRELASVGFDVNLE